MKLYSRKINKATLSLIAATMFITVFLLLTGCEKPPVNTYESFEATNLRVVNGLSGRSTVKFYLDTFNLTLTGTVNYATNTQYYVVRPGLRRVKFFSTVTKDTFAVKNFQLDVKRNYSLFLAGIVGSPKYFLTEDDLTVPSVDKSKLRLANLANTGAGIDVTIQKYDLVTVQPEVKVLTNVGSESVSNYALVTVPVSKGNAVIQPHNIRLYETGTTNLVASATAVDLRGTAINTIIAQGIRGGSPALTLRITRDWLDW